MRWTKKKENNVKDTMVGQKVQRNQREREQRMRAFCEMDDNQIIGVNKDRCIK